MDQSLKQRLLDAMTVPQESLDISPGLTVWIYGWTALEVDRWRQETDRADFGKDYLSATLFQRSVRDENGKNIFSSVDVPAIAAKGSLYVQRAIEVLNRLNGFGPKADEEIRKNSPTTDLTDAVGVS